MALLGTGLSARAGITTFPGIGASWRGLDAMDLASTEAWAAEPALLWLFYAWRRPRALAAKPNKGHAALAALARKSHAEEGKDELLAVNQNMDDLSGRAGHTRETGRVDLHGNFCFYFRSSSAVCDYVCLGDSTEPLCATLDTAALEAGGADLLDANTPLPVIAREELPRCPRCEDGDAAAADCVVWGAV